MKKVLSFISWCFVSLFILMAAVAISEKAIFGALFFLLGAMVLMPIDLIRDIKKKLKLNSVLTVVLAVVFLFAGVLTTPTPPDTSDDNTPSIIETETFSETNVFESVTEENQEENRTEEKPVTSSKETSTTTAKPSSTTKKDSEGVGLGKKVSLSLADVPAYSGSPYTVVQNNTPNFSSEELKNFGYESYHPLDVLGRTTGAIASVGKDTMPKEGEKRGSISSIHPSGWEQEKYEHISGKYLYNRCHLIGWQLSAENANEKNLVTGTKYLNVNGMLPFENMVADYIKETGNHVAYRITPIYDGENLLASGIEMEAYSVEDSGDGISFHIFCYNVQPGIILNYKDGSSKLETTQEPVNTTTSTTAFTTTTKAAETPLEGIVYITETGKRYHNTKSCRGLENANAIYESSPEDAKLKGLTPCGFCY